MNSRNPVQTFLTEAEDLLARIEEIALDLKPGQQPGEPIHQLFRAFHTLKGSGAMFGFDAVAAFTHHVETTLEKVREGIVPVSTELLNLILRSKDQIKGLFDAAHSQTVPDETAAKQIIAALNALSPKFHSAETPTAGEKETRAVPEGDSNSLPRTFRIRFRPDPGLMISGGNPMALLNELRGLGECEVVANTNAIPGLDQLRSDHCYLAWEIQLTTRQEENAVKDVFIFVEDGSALEIAAEHRPAPANPAAPSDSPADKPPQALPPAKASQHPAAVPSLPAGKPGETGSSRKPAAKEAVVRVPSERLDRLVNLVGELVMNQSRLTQVAARANVANLSGPVEELERLVAELRDNVLGIRMMPIGTTFSRFKRLVHDLSLELGKEITLVTEGEETELDKTVIDRLGDPLVHLIRNSIDHGIEPPDERIRLGKPRAGRLRLQAVHEGAHVVITIQDDGRGLDLAAIRAKAVEKGLVTSETQLSDTQIANLIFLPGFSTARQVSNVSGRGVGMDAAKRTIESLRGSIGLSSTGGQGTTVELTLPLTLAIIDGLLVEIHQERFIIAMSSVMENVELARAERQANNGRNVVAVRGELIPYIRLRELFEIRGAEPEIEKIVIVSFNGQRLGLVVDRVLGSHQTVIQPLGRFYRGIRLFSGTTIMGDGRVAMILDLGGIVRHAEQPPPAASSMPDNSTLHPAKKNEH